MRTLRFIVSGQIIKRDPTCDFENLVPGSEGYLKAEFLFSSDWDGCVKVAGFSSQMGTEYPPQVLADGKSCVIPAEATNKRYFTVFVVGKKDNLRLTTNKIFVSQDGGKA